MWDQDFSMYGLTATIPRPYPKIIPLPDADALKDLLFSDAMRTTLVVTADIGASVAGRGLYGWNLLLVRRTDDGADYCSHGVVFDAATVFTSDTPDITPPLVRALTTDKNAYRPGDVVTLTVTFSEPLSTQETDHLSFVNDDDPSQSLPDYGPTFTLTPVDTATYQVSFQIPAGAKPGAYRLDFLNRSDASDNFAAEVGEHDSVERHVAASHPLRID